MIDMKKIGLLAVAVLMMAACSNDETSEQGYKADNGEMLFQFVYPGVTRATDTNFENTDKIGVYVTAKDEPLQIGGNEVNNELFTYNGSSWTSSRKVYWNTGSHDVYAYYPYSKTVNDISDYAFQVQADQSTAAGYTASDFLWAGKKGVAASASPVTMTFAVNTLIFFIFNSSFSLLLKNCLSIIIIVIPARCPAASFATRF